MTFFKAFFILSLGLCSAGFAILAHAVNSPDSIQVQAFDPDLDSDLDSESEPKFELLSEKVAQSEVESTSKDGAGEESLSSVHALDSVEVSISRCKIQEHDIDSPDQSTFQVTNSDGKVFTASTLGEAKLITSGDRHCQ